MPRDFYDLLGVPDDASQDDIKAAWRQRAREYHPDVNDDVRAGAQFKTLRKAYEVLSDPNERSAYDRLGHQDYVSTHLDGLPTGGMSVGRSRWNRGESDGSAGAESSAGGGTARSTSSGGSRSSEPSSRSTSTRSSNRSRTASSSGRSRRSTSSASRSRSSSRSSSRSRSESSGTSSRSRSGSSSGSASNRSRSSGTSRNRSRSSGSSSRTSGTAGRSSQSNGRASTTSARTEAQSGQESRGRSPLWYGWVSVLVGLLTYLVGFGTYLSTNLTTVQSLVAAAATAPTATLLAPSGLDPRGFVLAGVATPGVELVFVGGLVCFPLALLVTVYRFGQGTAWLYPLGALVPAAVVGGAPVLPSVAALDLVTYLVLPLVGGLAFLLDVGRYLFARD